MPSCRITVIRKANYSDLSALYENPIENPCPLREGQVFVSHAGERPGGLCDSAWDTLRPFVAHRVAGRGDFFCGWMKNPASALISCNDGFRPVSFLLEAIPDLS